MYEDLSFVVTPLAVSLFSFGGGGVSDEHKVRCLDFSQKARRLRAEFLNTSFLMCLTVG